MKKKLCSLLIAICLFAFVLLSFAACASSNLKYEAMYGDDSYWWSVSGSYGDSTVKIPKKHNGVAVRTISSWAFSGDENLKKVTIPNTIDSIGGFAFDNCKSLKKVNLPRALKSIEHLLGKKAYFGPSCFSRCTSLEEIVIPENVLVLPEYIFHDCLSLKKVTLPSSLSKIEDYAFLACYALETVYFRGTSQEFKSLIIGERNECLREAKIIFIP
jgi:hypothetical protein